MDDRKEFSLTAEQMSVCARAVSVPKGLKCIQNNVKDSLSVTGMCWTAKYQATKGFEMDNAMKPIAFDELRHSGSNDSNVEQARRTPVVWFTQSLCINKKMSKRKGYGWPVGSFKILVEGGLKVTENQNQGFIAIDNPFPDKCILMIMFMPNNAGWKIYQIGPM